MQECTSKWANAGADGQRRAAAAAATRYEVGLSPADWTANGERLFDAVHVGFGVPAGERGAAAESELLRVLAPGGRMVAPVEIPGLTGEQWLTLFVKDAEGGGVRSERVAKLVCQPMEGEAFKPEMATVPGRKARLAELQRELVAWREGFTARSGGRAPSKDDMFGDAVAKRMFEEFAALRTGWETMPTGS